MQDLGVLEEVLRMVLEIVNSCLTHSVHHNPHLVYTLLYQRGLFAPFRTHPTFQDIIQNIDTVSVCVCVCVFACLCTCQSLCLSSPQAGLHPDIPAEPLLSLQDCHCLPGPHTECRHCESVGVCVSLSTYLSLSTCLSTCLLVFTCTSMASSPLQDPPTPTSLVIIKNVDTISV